MLRRMLVVFFFLIAISSTTAVSQDIRLRDFGVLKMGETYRAPSEYCYSLRDLRDIFAIHRSSGYLNAMKQWREKTAAKLCVEDPLADLTEFRVVKLVETVNLSGFTVYIVEVVVNDRSVFLISTISVTSAN